MNQSAKSALAKTIRALRARLIEDFANALEARYRLTRRVSDAGLDERREAERGRIDEYLDEQLRGEESKKKKQRRGREDFVGEIVREAAYTLINRLVLLRLMEEAELVKPAVLNGGWQSSGYREWSDWAPALLDDETDGYATLLGLLFDELAQDLPGLYGDVGLTELVPLPPQTLRAAVEALNDDALDPCWSDDTTLGWVYQYFNDPDREALDAKINSRGKVEPHEVASKTQLFTERYMVEWLLQNSLGPMWLEICEKNGWTPEVIDHGVLDELEARRADWRQKREAGGVELDELMPIRSEVEERWKYYVPPAENVDTGSEGGSPATSLRDLKILDPACGSGHFLVIAFDLLFALYREEARHRGESWSDRDITGWIIEDNLHGIDIDPRAVQIAAAALYLKGRQTVADYRPKKLNLVAPDLTIGNLPDDDPALVELRRAVEEETGIPADLVDKLVHSLKEAHHLGTLLKIDSAVEEAISEHFKNSKQGDLFGNSGHVVERLGGSEAASPSDADQFGRTTELHDSTPTIAKKSNTKDGSHELPNNADHQSPTTTQPPDHPTTSEAKPNHPTTQPPNHLTSVVSDLLEDFLAAHSSADDLGLRLRGEQLANGIRFVRLNREGRYDLVVANPPYLGSSNMRSRKYIKKQYPRGKADLYACFLERGLQLAREGGISAMVTMRGWMFIKTYEDLRKGLLSENNLQLAGDLDRGAFADIAAGPGGVAAVMAVFRDVGKNAPSVVVRPSPLGSVAHDLPEKRAALRAQVGRHDFSARALEGIDGQPLVYWWDDEFLKQYNLAAKIGEDAPAKCGICTTNNSRFIRNSFEVSLQELMRARGADYGEPTNYNWVPLIKGAEDREWIEPLIDICNWSRNGLEIKTLVQWKDGSVTRKVTNEQLYFRIGVACAAMGATFSARIHRFKSLFANIGASVFPADLVSALCFMNSRQARFILESLNPSVHFEAGDINRLPLFPIESADEIFARLDEAFTEHEAARETSVEFKKPGPSCWTYAQDWAQRAVDRPEGEPLPDWNPTYEEAPPENWLSWAIGVALGRFGPNGEGWLNADGEPSGSVVERNGEGGYEVERLGGCESSQASDDDQFVRTTQPPATKTITQTNTHTGPDESPTVANPKNSTTTQPPNHLTTGEAKRSQTTQPPNHRTTKSEKRSDRAPHKPLEAGILYISATDFDDSLADPACQRLRDYWDEYGDEVGRNKDDLNSWLREKFFKDVHRQMYDNAPIYFPVSSKNKNFVAHINIHGWTVHTLRTLRANHLNPEKRKLEELRDNLRTTMETAEGRTRSDADQRLDDTLKLLAELDEFIEDVRQCAEFGPPPTDAKCPPRETDAPYDPVLDDGTMINAAALWPILDPQWRKYPKKWWKRLANEKGYRGKHFDWSQLAARYFPTRVDEKCQQDPSLAVAHTCFWRYHPARAYEWELRLQDEIHPNFTIDEPGSDEARQAFFAERAEEVEDIRADEYNRRKRNAESEEEITPVVAVEEHPTAADGVSIEELPEPV